MQNYNYSQTIAAENNQPALEWKHFSVVAFTLVLLLGMTWLKQPQLFSFHKTSQDTYADSDVPKYYAYVDTTTAEPLVAGASTENVASVINEDGTISSVDMGEVLGASTEGVTLSLDEIKISKIVADSGAAINKYFTDSKSVESGPIDNTDFETALSSGNQTQIDQQAAKLIGIRDALQKMPVPEGLVKLHKLKIIQYNSAIGLLQNFTKADDSPEIVGQYLQEFLKSQEDLDSEETNVTQKYNLDPALVGAVGDTLSASEALSTSGNAQ